MNSLQGSGINLTPKDEINHCRMVFMTLVLPICKSIDYSEFMEIKYHKGYNKYTLRISVSRYPSGDAITRAGIRILVTLK